MKSTSTRRRTMWKVRASPKLTPKGTTSWAKPLMKLGRMNSGPILVDLPEVVEKQWLSFWMRSMISVTLTKSLSSLDHLWTLWSELNMMMMISHVKYSLRTMSNILMGATGRGTTSCVSRSQLKNETRDSLWTPGADTTWYPPRKLTEWICQPTTTWWWTFTLPMASQVQPNGLTSSSKPLTNLHRRTSWRTRHQWCQWASVALILVIHSYGHRGKLRIW